LHSCNDSLIVAALNALCRCCCCCCCCRHRHR
jgi:hypothetical protein